MFGKLFDLADDICETLEEVGVDTGLVGDIADLADDIFEEIEGE
ncbi:hypothetical protein NVP1187O_074 [Vibrio phage 1.187.O._10N.286.49.F1]|nr:hypothetical protein NVP1187O_074 [Vibrio phage 1.187.O._10N.286.49.F1]